jgi:hypothetical protein
MNDLVISSSWRIVNGDVCTADGMRNGRKRAPRKKRGRPISDVVRLEQLQKIERARDRRRGGFDITNRS